jgi:hypothetical protein
MENLTISVAWLFVATFLGVSFLGVLLNYFFTEIGVSEVNTTSNLIYLTTASWFIALTQSSNSHRI